VGGGEAAGGEVGGSEAAGGEGEMGAASSTTQAAVMTGSAQAAVQILLYLVILQLLQIIGC
jgi:hypothetical protein